MAGHSRQDVFNPLRGKGIAAAVTRSPGTSLHSILAKIKIFTQGGKSLKVQFVVFPTQFKIIMSWS